MIIEKLTRSIKETSVNISQSRVDSVRRKDITRSGIRVYDKGRIGISGALGTYDYNEKLAEAKAALDFNIQYPYAIGSNLKMKKELNGNIPTSENLIYEVEELLEFFRTNYPEFAYSEKFKITELHNKMENSQGLDLEYIDKYMSATLVVKEKSSGNILDAVICYYGRNFNKKEFISFNDSFLKANKNKLNYVPKKNMLVVFDSPTMPLKKLRSELNGEKYGAGSSLFSGKIGQKLFSDQVSIIQDKNPRYGYSPFFDAEGTVNDNFEYPLITNGVLEAVYTNKKIASQYNLPLTGAATSTYDGVPALGVAKIALRKAEKTLKELLNGEEAILVSIASGGDFTDKGDFSTPVQLSFLFDGEHIIGKLPELQLSSNIYDMFGKDYVGLSKDHMPFSENIHQLVMNMNVSLI